MSNVVCGVEDSAATSPPRCSASVLRLLARPSLLLPLRNSKFSAVLEVRSSVWIHWCEGSILSSISKRWIWSPYAMLSCSRDTSSHAVCFAIHVSGLYAALLRAYDKGYAESCRLNEVFCIMTNALTSILYIYRMRMKEILDCKG